MSDTQHEKQPDAIADTSLHWWQNQRLLGDFALHLWQQLKTHNAFQAAGSLCFTSLLALVPLLAVVLGVLSWLPIANNLVDELQNFLFKNFVPAAGETVQNYVLQFVGNTKKLTGAGAFFLIITSLMLMNTIEHSLNQIWQVHASRSFSSRLMMYWAVLTMGPMLIGGSVVLTSYITALTFDNTANLHLRFLPFLVAVLGFTLLYMVAPNRRVHARDALFGGLLTAMLFELAKFGFVWYVTNFPTYTKLYGALATFPIFLLWIYVTWIITLLGAIFTAAITTFHFRKADWHWSRRMEFVLLMRLLGHLWEAQKHGHGLGSNQLLELEPAMSDVQLQTLLQHLDDAHLINRDTDGNRVLVADLGELSLADLLCSGPHILPLGDLNHFPRDNISDRKLHTLLSQLAESAETGLNKPVKFYLASEQKPIAT